jgi:hypothetical protein
MPTGVVPDDDSKVAILPQTMGYVSMGSGLAPLGASVIP